MAYYVLGEQGQKYGPADISTLNQWISEGRVAPGTMLEDETSGGHIAAGAIGALQFPVAPSPMTSNYPRYSQPLPMQSQIGQPVRYSGGQSEFVLALVMALISPVLSFTEMIGGLVTGIIGLRAATRAKQKGHPLGVLVVVLNIVALAVWAYARL